MSDPSWRPDEDTATIFSEDTWIQGSMITCIVYGCVATLSIQCFSMLVSGFHRTRLWRDGPLIIFVTLIFLLCSAYTALAMQYTEQAFVNDRNFPGGPSAYEVAEFSIPLDAAANDMFSVIAFLADALLLWRCTVLYRACHVNEWIVTGVAIALWLGELVVGITYTVAISTTSVFGEVQITLAFFCYSLALNAIATILIVSRLFYYRRQLAKVFGYSHVAQYTGVMAMIVESELMYTSFLILFIVPFVLNHPVVNVFVQEICLVQSVAALMIVYRVAAGKSWTKNTYADITSKAPANSAIQLSNLSSFRAAPSNTYVAEELEETKPENGGGGCIVINREVYTTKDIASRGMESNV